MLRASPEEMLAQVVSVEDVEFKELPSAEAAAVSNIPAVDAEMEGDEESESDRGPLPRECVLHILDNIPERLRLLRELRAFVENELGLSPCEYLIGRYLARGGIQLLIHRNRADECNRNPAFTVVQLSQGVTLTRVVNKKADAARSVILYRVPVSFPVENFTEWFGEDLAGARRWTRKGTREESEIVELVFFDRDDATYYIKQRYIKLEGMAFKAEPKFFQRPRVCRVCKKVNPNHNPGHCKTITCGRCAGPHATRDHPIDEEAVKCPNCGDSHEFLSCPGRVQELNRSLRDQKKSYRDALVRSRRRASTSQNTTPRTPALTEENMDTFLSDPQNSDLLRLLLQKLLLKFNDILLPSAQPTAALMEPSVQVSFVTPSGVETTTPKRREHTPPSDGSTAPQGKKARPEFDPRCPKGCGFLCHKPGPMSQHVEACTGEARPRKSRTKSSGSRKDSTTSGQARITFLTRTDTAISPTP